MPLSRLENFLVNTDGNILYVNPSDLDATDSFDNKGNSLTRPFVSIQRALLEAARFSYQTGSNNDRYDKTTILLYPGTHYIDNRPGYYIKDDSGVAKYYDVNENLVASPNVELTNQSDFDLNSLGNVLYKFNSVDGGVVIPKGTSIVGLDLRKTKVKPLYVPDPEDTTIGRSAIFRVTGGCYFWQFSIFDADKSVYYNKDFTVKASPNRSHHKLTVFEYADGLNTKDFSSLTDLAMYYYKVMNAYGDDTGNREIVDYPTATDFEPNSPEYKIVGDLAESDLGIIKVEAAGTIATVETNSAHGLTVDDAVRVTGIGASDLYNRSTVVTGISSATKFTYLLPSTPSDTSVTPSAGKVIIEADNVTGASPYVFNCSMRSIYGMCGLHADGSKATGFKSMVVAQFTGIGLQKDDNAFVIYNSSNSSYNDANSASSDSVPLYTNQEAVYNPTYNNYHIKSSNSAFIQAVSVFAIGFSDHFLAESGADQSITNSNSNFGSKSLVSKGFRKAAFPRDDTGYVTHIVPPKDLQQKVQNILWKPLDVNITVDATVGVGTTAKLYLLDETDEDNPPTSIVNGYRIGAKENETMYLDVILNGVNYTYSSPILMQTTEDSVNGDNGPASKKNFVVDSINTTSNVLTLTQNNNFMNGESVRVYSDNGIVPDGLENEQLYYVSGVSTSSPSTIKLAKTFNDAVSASPSVINIENSNGGTLNIISRVTDKLPGEPGHPIQWDANANTAGNWYIIGSATTATNTIYDAFTQNQAEIRDNNASLYIQRTAESRDLNDRIYRLRYVIPKEYSNPVAKAPAKNYVLQESSTVKLDAGTEITVSDIKQNRNTKIIAGISTANLVATLTSEVPHKLSVGDRVLIKNVKSTSNPTGSDNLGYNGYFYVKSLPSTKSFTYDIPKLSGTFSNDLTVRDNTLPVFSRNEYDTSYTIQDVETIQEFVSGQKDGVYYLTCLIGNISPTVSQFASNKFKQNILNLYPTVDVDNQNNDPEPAISVASNKTIGKVSPNDSLNSITKEGVIEYLKDNRVGFGVTGAFGNVSGISTLHTAIPHDLNSITGLTLSNAGAGYGSAGIRYNATLVGTGLTGEGATVNAYINGSNQVASVQIVDGGAAYGIGQTMRVVVSGTSPTTNAIVQISSINDAVGKVVQVIGVGTDKDRTNSGYNGLHKITSIPSSKSVAYDLGSNAGIYTGSPQRGIFYVVDDAIGIGTITGVANTTTAGSVTIHVDGSHGLAVGNRIKISGVTGTAASNYNSDFVVKTVINRSKFTIKPPIGITTTGVASAELYKYGIGALGEDSSLENEKIAGSLLPMEGNVRTKLAGGLNSTKSNDLSVVSTVGIKTGDWIQVDSEIMRVKKIENATTIDVFRGTLGTKSVSHKNNSVFKTINVIPSETRRFSSVRASGHTFEYVGYGPGNYSTALPQRQNRSITEEEELLALSREEKGGIVFYSGMNDRGEFFSGERVQARENFLGKDLSDLTAVFDDVYIRNTLVVGGGPNRNLPSEFRGPVNFLNKITSTSGESGEPDSGIEAIKLLLKGNPTVSPSLQVGNDNDPSFIVKENTKVGIRTATPAHELDVSGTIRADAYENFRLKDLPDATEEVTFKRNRVLKVKDDSSGYELVDAHELDAYKLRGLSISNDGTVYIGIGTTVSNKLQISGISTARFYEGEYVKVFGISTSGASTISAPTSGQAITKVGTAAEPRLYNYWVAEFDKNHGHMSPATIINPSGIAHTSVDNFNDVSHFSLSLTRASANHGLLIYRQDQVHTGTSTALTSSQLVGILGDEVFGNGTSATWKDYGTYDQTEWSVRGTKNEYDDDQIHFPVIGTVSSRRGWAIDSVVEVGVGYITLANQYGLNDNVGFGTTNAVKVVHDNTYALKAAIDKSIADGGNYLDFPSGTYLAEQIIIPNSFTLKGNGKNSIIKQQYFASSLYNGKDYTPENEINTDGIFVGIGTTLGANAPEAGTPCSDITLQDITIDGNVSNNINYNNPSALEQDRTNYLVDLENIKGGLVKGVEIRNSPGGGLYARNTNRLSVENSTFVDGCDSDRTAYQPLDASESTSLRVNDCLFENYPGPLDVSSTSVVSTGGNIIRACGTGLRYYSTGKITTSNNIILGPADEWIPSPDIYDSDWNSVNVTIDNDFRFESPTYLYVEDGDAKDLSGVTISGGIGTMLNVGGGTTETLGPLMTEITMNFPDPGGTFSQANGYIKFEIESVDTAVLGLTSAYGYKIQGEEYREKPVGFTTYVGIGTGDWVDVGTGVTSYYVHLDDSTQFSGISTGAFVKLVAHNVSPNLASQVFVVDGKTVTAGIHSLRLKPADNTWNQTGSGTITGTSDGTRTGYISIRNQFIIAKGRVGVI
tara:strand:+ start:7461 stop:14519 length:7059 start_codon:yes stop_codon:yes gene_type:complete